jgi:hypothetical protein
MSFYSSTIFSQSGFSDAQALYASIGFGALNFAFAIPSLFLIDTYGRRTLLLWTFPNVSQSSGRWLMKLDVLDTHRRWMLFAH